MEKSARYLERKEEKKKVREMMKLEKGSKLARQESKEKRKIRNDLLQGLLDEQLRERDQI